MPRTYILCAPSDATDPLGRVLTHIEILRRLRILNPLITAPLNANALAVAKTALWLGDPATPGNIPICAMPIGVVPEFTQIAPNGTLIARGWRSVLDRVIKRRAATRGQLERAFGYISEADGLDKNCVKCRKLGNTVRATSHGGLCNVHSDLMKQVVAYDQFKSAMRGLAKGI